MYPETEPAVVPALFSTIPPQGDGRAAIVALDLGTTTGFALRNAEGQITSGTASFKPSRYDGGGIRYLKFGNWLTQFAATLPISTVYYEAVRRHLGTDASHIYGGLLATLSAWCEQRRIPYQGVPVGTIKRHIAG